MKGRVKALATAGFIAALVVVAVSPARGDETPVPLSDQPVQSAGTESSPASTATSATDVSTQSTTGGAAPDADKAPTSAGTTAGIASEATESVSADEALAIAQELNATKNHWAGTVAPDVVAAVPDGDHVVVLVDGSAGTRSVVDDRIPSDVERNVTVARGGIALAAGPNTDAGPAWNGGTWITNGSVNCTAGFSWVKSGVRLLGTAAHCGGGTWKGATGSVIGTVRYTGTSNNDVELIAPASGKSVTTNVWTMSGSTPKLRPVTGMCTNAVDDTVTFYGRSSGQSQGGVLAVNWGGEGRTLTTANAVRRGDSGGPVFSVKSDGSVCARGTVHALTYQDTNNNGGYDNTDKVTGMIFIDASYTARNFGAAVATNLPTLTVSVVPTIAGSGLINEPLTVSEPQWSPAPTAVSVQWKRNGLNIPGATSLTYTPVAADVDTSLTVTMTGIRSGYTNTVVTSAARKVAGYQFTTAPRPIVTGTNRVGGRLAVSAGTWDPTPTSFTYQWYRNGVAIAGATKTVYSPTASDYRKLVSVKVTAHRLEYSARTAVSWGYAPALGVWTHAWYPRIAGTQRVGVRVTAYVPTWSPAATSMRYQWYRNGAAISGATGKTYILRSVDRGKKITVRVTGSRPGYPAVARLSRAIVPR